VSIWNGAAFAATKNGLIRTDGTSASNEVLAAGLAPELFLPGTSMLFMRAQSALWVTGGSVATTRQVVTEASFSTDDAAVAGDGRLFFVGRTPAAGRELWVSDGSDSGTRLVRDIGPTAASGIRELSFAESNGRRTSLLAALGSSAMFAADDGSHGEELWTSDGSPGNATMIEIASGAAGSFPRWLARVGGRVFFAADDGVHGREPWVTDGTPEGTHLIADVRPGPDSSAASDFVDWNGSAAFAADDGLHGMELWLASADGSTAELILDAWPGLDPSSPQGLTASGEQLFFFADDGVHGLEPWAWPLALFKDGFESSDQARWQP
jgi:ELWxxDGT repeat protein